MFFKKSKEKKALALKESRRAKENRFREELKRLEQVADPARKVLVLQSLSDSINSEIANQTREIDSQANSSRRKAKLGGASAVCVSGVVAASVFTTPVGGAIVLGAAGLGYLGSIALGHRRGESVHDKLMLEATGHVMELGSIMMAANDLRDKTLEDNVKAIAGSPLNERIQAYPRLAEKFAAAAAKHLVENKDAYAAARAEKKRKPSGFDNK